MTFQTGQKKWDGGSIIFKGVVINIVNLFVIILKKEKEKKNDLLKSESCLHLSI